VGRFAGEAGSARATQRTIRTGTCEQPRNLPVPSNYRQHQRTQPELCGCVQIGTSGHQRFDDSQVSRVRSQHETRLPMAVTRIDVRSALEQVADRVGITARDRILPERIHP